MFVYDNFAYNVYAFEHIMVMIIILLFS